MRLFDVIMTALLLGLFSSSLAGSVQLMKKMDSKIEEAFLKTASLKFISQSFSNVSSGKGFKDFYEWEKSCRAIWKLEEIEWEVSGADLYSCSWKGPWGSGEAYCRMRSGTGEKK